MNKDYLKDIYKDFFDTSLVPKIEVKEEETIGSEEKLASLFLDVDNLYISD